MAIPNQDTSLTTVSTPDAKAQKRCSVPSPDAEILSQSKTVDICGHCNKKCAAKGLLSEAIHCDMCYS